MSTGWASNGGGYDCCDDWMNCPFSASCQDSCNRRAEGMVIVYITDYDNQETEIARRSFAFDSEEAFTFRQIGTLSWPAGNFQW